VTDMYPREGEQQVIRVVGGAGSIIVNLIGYLDAVLWDVPGSETYKYSIKGPSGVEYFISSANHTGDVTVLHDPRVPLTGKMTFSVIGANGDGEFRFRPVGPHK